jgi:isocitrate dehydrogenase (NAD+)
MGGPSDRSRHSRRVAHGGDPASSQGINTRQECLRVIRFALDYDVRQGRKKVTVMQKANVLKALTGIFLEAGRQVAKEYAGSVEMNDRMSTPVQCSS